MVSRTGQAGLLIVGIAGGVFALALALIDANPAISSTSDTHVYLQVTSLLGGAVGLACLALYALLARSARERRRATVFEQSLQLRNAMLASIPTGLLLIVVATGWYVVRRFSKQWDDGGNLDTVGVLAFAGLGAITLVVIVVLAVRFERRAISSARADVAEVLK